MTLQILYKHTMWTQITTEQLNFSRMPKKWTFYLHASLATCNLQCICTFLFISLACLLWKEILFTSTWLLNKLFSKLCQHDQYSFSTPDQNHQVSFNLNTYSVMKLLLESWSKIS